MSYAEMETTIEILRAHIRELESELIETRQQRDKAEYDRTYAIGCVKNLLRELGETCSAPSAAAAPASKGASALNRTAEHE